MPNVSAQTESPAMQTPWTVTQRPRATEPSHAAFTQHMPGWSYQSIMRHDNQGCSWRQDAPAAVTFLETLFEASIAGVQCSKVIHQVWKVWEIPQEK